MKLSLSKETLKVRMEGWEIVWALKRSLSLPLKNIAGVGTTIPRPTWKEVKAPGTMLPGMIKAGTYYTGRGKEFWYAKRGKKFLVLELRNERYKRVILGVPNNKAWVVKLTRSIKAFKS